MKLDKMIEEIYNELTLEEEVQGEEFQEFKNNLEYFWDPYYEYVTEQDVEDFHW